MCGEILVDGAGWLVDAFKNLFVAYVKLNNHATSIDTSSMCDRKCGIALRMVKEPDVWLLTRARLQATWSIRADERPRIVWFRGNQTIRKIVLCVELRCSPLGRR